MFQPWVWIIMFKNDTTMGSSILTIPVALLSGFFLNSAATSATSFRNLSATPGWVLGTVIQKWILENATQPQCQSRGNTSGSHTGGKTLSTDYHGLRVLCCCCCCCCCCYKTSVNSLSISREYPKQSFLFLQWSLTDFHRYITFSFLVP